MLRLDTYHILAARVSNCHCEGLRWLDSVPWIEAIGGSVLDSILSYLACILHLFYDELVRINVPSISENLLVKRSIILLHEKVESHGTTVSFRVTCHDLVYAPACDHLLIMQVVLHILEDAWGEN